MTTNTTSQVTDAYANNQYEIEHYDFSKQYRLIPKESLSLDKEIDNIHRFTQCSHSFFMSSGCPFKNEEEVLNYLRGRCNFLSETVSSQWRAANIFQWRPMDYQETTCATLLDCRRHIEQKIRTIQETRQVAQQKAREARQQQEIERSAEAARQKAKIEAEKAQAVEIRRIRNSTAPELMGNLPRDVHVDMMKKWFPVKDLLVLERINKRFQRMVKQVLVEDPLLRPLTQDPASIKQKLYRILYSLGYAAHNNALPIVYKKAAIWNYSTLKCSQPEFVLSRLPRLTNSEILKFVMEITKNKRDGASYLNHLINTQQIVVEQNGALTVEEQAALHVCLAQAIEGEDIEAVKLIIEFAKCLSIPLRGIDSFKQALSYTSCYIKQDFMIAALKILLDAETPMPMPNLHLFVPHNLTKIVEFLFRRGASLGTREWGKTPLEFAKSLDRNPEMVVCLEDLQKKPRPALPSVEDVSDSPEALKKLARDQEAKIEQMERGKLMLEQEKEALESSNKDYAKEVVPLRAYEKEALSLREENSSLKQEIELLKAKVLSLGKSEREAALLREEATTLRRANTKLKNTTT